MEQRVLNTNPLLEAFGNAKTLRNDNSSRFGKFIKIQFANEGQILGATIEKYLLEKTRVIHQTSGEGNYHIFYQLIKGSSPELLEEVKLSRDISQYQYLLNDKDVSFIPNVKDEDEFVRTSKCMESIGIQGDSQKDLLSLISGILHLGNVNFGDDDVDGQVTGLDTTTGDSNAGLTHAAEMVGVQASELLTCLTQQNMHVSGATIIKMQSKAQAVDKRNSVAKSIYAMIFNWLVGKINSTISPSKEAWGYIGLLDIYGFENFDNLNSFEQLLINYANEKLQSHFNKVWYICIIFDRLYHHIR